MTVQGTGSPAESILIDGVGSGIFTTTEGTGKGGNIFVSGNSVTLPKPISHFEQQYRQWYRRRYHD